VSFLRSDFKAGDPIFRVCNARNLNRIGRVLETIEGVGCRVVRNYSAEGGGWKIVVDGSSDAGPLPDSAGILTSDRLCAVDSVSKGRLHANNIYGYDSAGCDTLNDIPISFEVITDSRAPWHQVRHFIRVSDTLSGSQEMLARDGQGNLMWSTPPIGQVKCDSADTLAYLKDQFVDTAAYAAGTDVPVKAVMDTATKKMRLFLDLSTGTAAYILGKTAGGALCWVPTRTDCPDS
jgi:hypothetical protein